MARRLYLLFRARCSTGFQKRATFSIFSKSARCSEIWKRPFQSWMERWKSNSIDTALPGRTAALWVGGRQQLAWQRGEDPENEVGNLPLPPTGCVDVREGAWSWAPFILCVWSLAGSGLCRGNVVRPLTGPLSTKASPFCF